MKVICDRGALVSSLGLVGGVIASRTPKAALTCVKLTASTDEGLVLEGTDTEVSIRLATPRVEVSEPGEALIPADKLQQIVRESVDATLTLSTKQDVAHITGQDSKFKVFGHPPTDFPGVAGFSGDADFTLAAGDLHRMVAQTLFATARENSRYAINGVLMERTGKKLVIVATDGHRLALARGTCKTDNTDTRSAIIPTKALNLLLKLFDDAEETVHVRVEDNQIIFKTDQAVLAANLVEGNFPPYSDVIPKDGDKKATLATDALVSATRRAALLTNEESKGVRLAFTQDGLTLSSRAPEMGEAEITVPLTKYEGDDVEIGFNPAYVLDALKVIDESEVQLDLNSSNKPGVIRSGPNFLYVIMPVSLQ
ncbi:MAG: DNA polymerase III subunit beta [Algisphaera sp.]